METACPHCAQALELDEGTLEALRGESHFQCPTCAGVVPVPSAEVGMETAAPTVRLDCPHCQQALSIDAATWSALQAAPSFDCPSCAAAISLAPEAPASSPVTTRATPAAAVTAAHRGLNRNLIILGTAALLLLGGLGIFLAKRKGPTAHQTQRAVREIVANNKFFTDLKSKGAKIELLAEVRPFGIGFIGVSKDPLPWEKAAAFAESVQARVLTVEPVGHAMRTPLLEMLAEEFPDLRGSTAWVFEHGEPRALDAPDVSRVTTLERSRRVFVHWFDGTGKNRFAPDNPDIPGRKADAAAVPPAEPVPNNIGIPVPGKPGFITSPFSPNAGLIDIRGMPKGAEVKDPSSGRILRVP